MAEMYQAGWYPDPDGNPARERYYNGSVWTDEYREVAIPVHISMPNAYGQPQYYQAAKDKYAGFAVAALVLGIISLLIFPVITGAIAIVFGVLGMKSRKKGMAIAGLVLGIIGAASGILIQIFCQDYLNDVLSRLMSV